MHSICVFSSGTAGDKAIDKISEVERVNSVSRQERLQDNSLAPRATVRTAAKTKHYVWYSGFFGRIDVQSKSTSFNRSDTDRRDNKAMSTQDIIRITPILLRKTFELRFGNSFGHISRTLNTYPILDDDAPIFRTCEKGDLQGLQALLSSRTVSPFVVNESGDSLLHVSGSQIMRTTQYRLNTIKRAVLHKRPEVCRFLVEIGVDLNHTDKWG